MKRVAIISKPGSPELGRIVPQITSWLRDHGYTVIVDAVTSNFCKDAEVVDANELVLTPRLSRTVSWYRIGLIL